MKLIFIRHGEDDGRYRGGWSEMDLTEAGKVQVQKLADFVWENRAGFDIAKIISSDLPRAMSTAKGISDKLNIPVSKDARLREMNNGDLAGMRNDEALAKYPGLFFHTLQMDEPYPNGESPRDFYHRIKGWFCDALKADWGAEGNLVIVTHGGVINIIYHIVKQLEWSNKGKPFKASNCGLHILDAETMQFELENYTAFLHSFHQD